MDIQLTSDQKEEYQHNGYTIAKVPSIQMSVIGLSSI